MELQSTEKIKCFNIALKFLWIWFLVLVKQLFIHNHF